MTFKQIVTVLGGLTIGAVVSLVILLALRIPIASFGAVNLAATTLLFGLVGMIALDSLLIAGFLSK